MNDIDLIIPVKDKMQILKTIKYIVCDITNPQSTIYIKKQDKILIFDHNQFLSLVNKMLSYIDIENFNDIILLKNYINNLNIDNDCKIDFYISILFDDVSIIKVPPIF